ncbi:MAG TPA: four helix bundle protein [Bacteroidales bacterium]|nr:four helix bundle protein [Bacteroidales bacterium]
MENKDFSKQLQARTKAFAIGIIKLSSGLPNSVEGRIIRSQLAKAGTSIGANYREANRSRSKADFRSKIRLCESESSETCYWLEIISDMKWNDASSILIESNELLAIFTSIGKNLN